MTYVDPVITESAELPVKHIIILVVSVVAGSLMAAMIAALVVRRHCRKKYTVSQVLIDAVMRHTLALLTVALPVLLIFPLQEVERGSVEKQVCSAFKVVGIV